MAVARSPEQVRSELERIYLAHAEGVVHSVALATGSTAIAWDALQDTFVEMHRKLAAGVELRDEQGYVLRIARRKASRARSRNAREEPIADDAEATADVTAAGMAGASLIWQACRALTTAQRVAVLMHDVQDLATEEIGRQLGTSRFSAAKLVQRGRAEMLANLVKLVGRRRGCPAECASRAPTIWSWISNELDFEPRERLRAHVSACAYCRETEDQLRQARSLGVLPLLLPLAEILRRKDQILALVQVRRVSNEIGWRLRPVLLAIPLTILLIIGVVKVPQQLAPATIKPGTQPVAVLASPTPTPSPSPSPTGTPSPVVVSSPVPAASAAAARPPADPCPTGGLGGLAYLSAGRVMYRNSPQAASQVLDGTGRADDLRWTPNGATLVYKEAATSGSVAGSLRALHPGGGVFWSFGSDIQSYDISTDGRSIVALAQHYDASGNWDAWTLYTGPPGRHPDAPCRGCLGGSGRARLDRIDWRRAV
jgi:DNA-directed RNA polymerase specialized sigma24 family protein